MRSASNPGDIGHAWVKSRFISPSSRAPGAEYVAAKIADNPYMDYEAYLQSLSHMNPVDQMRLINGDWDVMEEGGTFARDSFKVIDEYDAPRATRSVRYWDLAATEASYSNPDPDFTCGVRLDRTVDGSYVVRDIVHGRFSASGVEQVVRQTANEDGTTVDIYIEQEPGSSGKIALEHFKRDVLPGFAVHAGLPRGNNHHMAFLDECSIFPNGGQPLQDIKQEPIRRVTRRECSAGAVGSRTSHAHGRAQLRGSRRAPVRRFLAAVLLEETG
jgi:hypothetical protein